jgi:hypothetical protein
MYTMRSHVVDFMAMGLPFTNIADASISTAKGTFYDLDGDERPPIFTWIDVGNEIEILKLLQQDPSLANSTLPEGGWTPLHFAAEVGNVEIIRLLIQDYGVDPNIRAIPTYNTPLHGAAGARMQNKVKTINELLRLGADINALCYPSKKKRLATALELAIELFSTSSGFDHEQQMKDAIALLFRKGANYLRDIEGETRRLYFY